MMVELRAIRSLARWRRPLLEFLQAHGDRRLTRTALDWLGRAPDRMPEQPGCCVLAAVSERRLVGVCAAADWGETVCVVAVHRGARGLGLGRALMSRTLERLGSLTCRVAADNAPSLAMCRSLGMTPVSRERGPTGKPTFVLRGVMQDQPFSLPPYPIAGR